MNVIDVTVEEAIQLDLKYCERCGGLWLRRKGTSGVYCAGCKEHFEALPNRGAAPPRKVRRRKSRAAAKNAHADPAERSGHIEHIEGTASMEVWA
jgi:Zn-finger nucleic acid-binding protein